MPAPVTATIARMTEGSLPCEAELRPDVDIETGIDLSLIRENLKLSPWERILANDDTINFCDMAASAMKGRNAAA